jgi:hypothetical protein
VHSLCQRFSVPGARIKFVLKKVVDDFEQPFLVRRRQVARFRVLSKVAPIYLCPLLRRMGCLPVAGNLTYGMLSILRIFKTAPKLSEQPVLGLQMAKKRGSTTRIVGPLGFFCATAPARRAA